jgi:hypothetical protein
MMDRAGTVRALLLKDILVLPKGCCQYSRQSPLKSVLIPNIRDTDIRLSRLQ